MMLYPPVICCYGTNGALTKLLWKWRLCSLGKSSNRKIDFPASHGWLPEETFHKDKMTYVPWSKDRLNTSLVDGHEPMNPFMVILKSILFGLPSWDGWLYAIHPMLITWSWYIKPQPSNKNAHSMPMTWTGWSGVNPGLIKPWVIH